MTTYERIFGAGPRGILLTIALFAITWVLKPTVGLPMITHSMVFRWALFVLSVIGAIGLAVWSVRSLPPGCRGQALTTTGAYRCLRHPVYATFLSCFDFGLAVLLNNWIFILWAILTHGLWHLNIVSEERLMREAFPDQYDEYSATTGRFIPRLNYFRRGK